MVEAGDIALHSSGYEIDIGEKRPVSGRTADVLCRDTDGIWRIVIDNPWAGSPTEGCTTITILSSKPVTAQTPEETGMVLAVPSIGLGDLYASASAR